MILFAKCYLTQETLYVIRDILLFITTKKFNGRGCYKDATWIRRNPHFVSFSLSIRLHPTSILLSLLNAYFVFGELL